MNDESREPLAAPVSPLRDPQQIKAIRGLAEWIRTPGNINRDDAIDECARAISNLADQLERMSPLRDAEGAIEQDKELERFAQPIREVRSESRTPRDETATSGVPLLEVRRDHSGFLDEVVAFGAYVHLERMARDHWWLKVSAAGKEVDVNLYGRRRTSVDPCIEEATERPSLRPDRVDDGSSAPQATGNADESSSSSVSILRAALEEIAQTGKPHTWRTDRRCVSCFAQRALDEAK